MYGEAMEEPLQLIERIHFRARTVARGKRKGEDEKPCPNPPNTDTERARGQSEKSLKDRSRRSSWLKLDLPVLSEMLVV